MLTKEQFLREAEKAYDEFTQHDQVEDYSFVLHGLQHNSHTGNMSCRELFMWATEHLIHVGAEAVVERKLHGEE